MAQPAEVARSHPKFEDVEGKWTGDANNHRVTLEIDSTGKFRAGSAIGSERGEARLEGETLVIPLEKHNGTLRLVHIGDTLTGNGVLDGKNWVVTLWRANRARRSNEYRQ